MPRFQRIPTGRSWRDLPPSPPTTFVPAPTLPDDPDVQQRSPVSPWPFLVGGVAIVALGFVVGVLIPGSSGPDDAAAETTTTLPEVIVPPSPTSTVPDGDSSPSSAPEPEPPPADDELFALSRVPDGYRIAHNGIVVASERIEQNVVLTNDVLEVQVSAVASAAEPALPAGEPITVRGQDGVMTGGEDGQFVITWIEPGKILFSIEAPDEFGVAAALLLAQALEVR